MWSRRRVYTTQCPVSYITGASEAWVERFSVWKMLGGLRPEEMDAKTVDAMCVLEGELRKELKDGER